MRTKIGNRPLSFMEKIFKSPPSTVFILMAVVMAGFSYLLMWFNSFYYGKPVSEIISFKVSDGWCPTPKSGFGLHCFGDYYSPVLALDMKNPWEIGYSYTPISTLLFRPFHLLANIFDNPRIGLTLYLLLGAACMLTAAFWAARESGFGRLYFPLVFGVLSTPWIQALDRGNSIMFVTPLMLGFAVTFYREKWFQTTCFIVVAVVLKPQFVFLFLPYLAYRKWRELFLGLSAIATVNVLGFLIFTDHPVRTFKLWVNFNSNYDSGLLDNRLSNANVSIRQGLLDVTTIIDREFFNGQALFSRFVYDHSERILFLILIVLVVAIFIAAKRSSKTHLVVASLVCSSLVIGTSWMYYQVFALVVAALLLRNPEISGKSTSGGVLDYRTTCKLDKLVKLLIVIATLNSCFNLPIDADILPFDYVEQSSSVSRLLVGPLWLLVVIAIIAKFIQLVVNDALRSKTQNANETVH
jgi:hypothetical protein